MRLVRAIFIPGLILLACAPASGAPAPDRALYEEARQAILEMRWKEADAALGRLLESRPDSAYADDALYWRGFARAEAGDCGSAYEDLSLLEERYAGSPRAAAGRVLRVRCAGILLATDSADPRRADYARLIAAATRSDTLSARLSAAEVLLGADPVEGARALRALAPTLEDRSLLDVLLDRHFGASAAVARPADPARPLGPANAVILVRRAAGVDALGVAEALRASRDDSGSSYGAAARAAIERSLDDIRRAMESAEDGDGREVSRVVHVEDSEIHLYRGSGETVRILVLDRARGYQDSNVRVFFERGDQQAEMGAREAERMAEGGDTRVMGPRALTFVGSSLALIRLDLGAVAGLGGRR